MTPDAIRIVSQLRQDFYSLFATAIGIPVRISGKSYISNSAIASWVDDQQRLNYLNIYPYLAPDKFIPERPFILRIAINKSAGRFTRAKQGQICKGLNQDWDFELTLLPEELLDFQPWIVGLVNSHNHGAASFVEEPPHPMSFKVAHVGLYKNAWTQKANLIATNYQPTATEGLIIDYSSLERIN
jgi:hypothetical protein